MEQQLQEIYETACKTSEEIISKKLKLEAQAIVLLNGEGKIYPLVITEKNKKMLQDSLKTYVIKSGAKGYIIILDPLVTVMNKKTKKVTQDDCCVRLLYTPTEKIMDLVWYTDGEIVDRDKMIGRDMMFDEWDAWNTGSVELIKRGMKK